MTHNISNPEVFCETEKFALETMTSVSKISVYDFFREYICPLASKEKGKVFAAKVLAYAGRSGTCKLFAKFINFFIYNEASLNEKFADAHDMSTYCAFMLSMDKSDLVDKTEMRSKESLFKINCPVDVDVIDRDTGEVVGRIRNNVVDEEFLAKPDSVVMTVNGDSKAAWLPANGNYEVRLIGNGTGTMDCTVSTIGAEGTETARSGFFDVAIAPGLTMECPVPANAFTPDSATLTLADGTTINPETLPEADLDALEICVSTEGQGFANSMYNLTKGDYVTASATANTNNSFLGWYENGVLISTDVEYSFVAKTDRSLTARFTNNPLNLEFVKWDLDMNESGKVILDYYETNQGGNQTVAKYYFLSESGYKFHTEPQSMQDQCTFSVFAWNDRILRVDTKTGRIIPVGCGETRLTVSAKAPDGTTKNDTVVVVVRNSPFIPITDVEIGYNPSTSNISSVSYNAETNMLTMSYKTSFQFVPILSPSNAKSSDITVVLDDGRTIKTVSAAGGQWISSDENVLSIDSSGKVTRKEQEQQQSHWKLMITTIL